MLLTTVLLPALVMEIVDKAIFNNSGKVMENNFHPCMLFRNLGCLQVSKATLLTMSLSVPVRKNTVVVSTRGKPMCPQHVDNPVPGDHGWVNSTNSMQQTKKLISNNFLTALIDPTICCSLPITPLATHFTVPFSSKVVVHKSHNAVGGGARRASGAALYHLKNVRI